MFKCPTSELPIWPSGRPTRSSEASIVVCGQVASRRCQFGIAVRVIALSGASARHPKPSRISRMIGRIAGRGFAGAEAVAGAGDEGGHGKGGDTRTNGAGYRRSNEDTALSFYLLLLPGKIPPPMTFLAFVEKNWMLFAALIASGGMLIWPFVSGRMSGGREIGTLGATQLINSRNALLLDVREPKEVDGSRLPNAVHVPLSQLESRGGELGKYVARPVI